MIRRIAALVGSLLVAGPVVAGPLPVWSYRTVIETAPGQTELFLGKFARQDRDVARELFAYSGLPTAGDAGTAGGSGRITLAELGTGDYRLADEPTVGADRDGFRVLLEITDAASGARGFTYLNARGSLRTDLPASLASESVLQGSGHVKMQLGGSRYDVRWSEDGGDGVSRLVADVCVTTVNTPEPATLVLAGLGLAGVAGRRLLRKRS